MKIGVVIQSSLQLGGGFQHEMTVAAILNAQADPRFEFVFFTPVEENLPVLRSMGIDPVILKFFSLKWLRHRLHQIKSLLLPTRAIPAPWSPLDGELERHGVDLVFFTSPSSLSLELRGHNYLFTIWDLCHLDYPEFPEVNFGNEFESREHLYRNAIRKATAVLVDSPHGKKNVVLRYQAEPERVAVLPFLPGVEPTQAREVDVRTKYGIDGDYIFYPAQFWPHKNHAYIIDALKLLADGGSPVHAVFSGSDKGCLGLVLQKAAALGISHLVHPIGFVARSEMPTLYRQALALVMPTYFGPTNIPPLEAFGYGCPVCYSDLPGLRDQVGDAAYLLDLARPASLVEALESIKNDPATVARKQLLGKEMLASWTEADYWMALVRIFESYAAKLRCWKMDS